jgi:hypothetical protein
MHGGLPQVLGWPPPPQVSPGAVQVPQSRIPPQPSPIMPHVAPCAAQVVAPVHIPPSPVPESKSMPLPVELALELSPPA